ncbi:MAG: hypothetical protein PVH41_15140 [Anaerolineae bacterium]|jgi:hypothetical protein
MDIMAVLAALGVVAVFVVVLIILRSGRREAEQRRQMAQELGFTPIEPYPELTARIAALYPQRGRAEPRYGLRHVSRRATTDGEMYIFDLVDVAGEDDSWVETQGVAVVSSRVNLPRFLLYTKPDMDGWVSRLADSVIDWAVTRQGTRVEFPEHPQFESRYVVTSKESEAVRRFFEGAIVGRLPETGLYSVHGGGPTFAFGELATKSGSVTVRALGRRIDRAMSLSRLFQRDWRGF